MRCSFSLLLSSVGLVSTLLIASPVTAQPLTEEQQEHLRLYGWLVGTQSGLQQLEFSESELDIFVEGLRAAIAGEEGPEDIEQQGPRMSAFLQGRAEAMQKAQAEVNRKTSDEFLSGLKGKEGVEVTDSGLMYQILEAGNDVRPLATDRVKVHYEGRLTNGNMFDSSIKRGRPAEFGLDQVIRGWTEGLQKIGEGGKIILYVPSDLGYGDEGRPGIPPASTLIFEVELLEVLTKKQVAYTPAVGVADVKAEAAPAKKETPEEGAKEKTEK